jgi:thioesterase
MLDEASLLAVNPLSCPILAFGGDRDAFVDQEGVEGWRFHTNTKFRCRFFHGGHFFIWDSMNEIAKNIVIEMGYISGGRARVVLR